MQLKKLTYYLFSHIKEMEAKEELLHDVESEIHALEDQLEEKKNCEIKIERNHKRLKSEMEQLSSENTELQAKLSKIENLQKRYEPEYQLSSPIDHGT